jgi:uncharacterized protein YjiS (DUF1127 family)
MTAIQDHSVDFAASPLLLLAPVAASSRDAMKSHSLAAIIKRGSDQQRGVSSIVDIVLRWHERARQRRALMALSDHMLRDIGCSRADAHGEAAKPFWRA